MTTRNTTEEHRTPGADLAPPGTPVWLAAFPEARAIPTPPLGVPVGRAYFAEHGHVDHEISTAHFKLERRGSALHIQDLDSRNGTWIAGHRLPPREPARLADGALVRLGKSLFIVRDSLQGSTDPDPPEGGLVGPWGLRPVREALRDLRKLPSTAVLIQGDTGTGKEVVARAVASALGRKGPYGAINVAAIAPAMLEGHLFGWVRGAFTGADRTDPGLIRAHAGGTVFLDEIGEPPPSIQAKLLRVIENNEVLPIGQHQPSKVDVAFIAATNRDLTQMVEEGTFRADLLARFPSRISLPPLCERPEDLYSLLVARWAHQVGRSAPPRDAVEVEAVERLLLHDWPANVRDVDRLVLSVLGEGFELRAVPVQKWLRANGAEQVAPEPVTPSALAAALTAHGGNKSRAAAALNVHRGVVTRMLEKYPELKGPVSKKG